VRTIKGFLISAPQSGSGKTTVSLAIMAALTRRGVTVTPFKCGPDFIDPGYHRAVTGRPSINLDAWMCPEEFVRSTFQNAMANADPAIAVIEGVMGLFDGIASSSTVGSSAQIAALTGSPVVLVVNARGMAASAAALVNGFAGFDPQVRLAGVIFNNVGSDSHAALLKEALTAHCPGIACFGCIQRDENLAIPSRHLGLVTAEDNPLDDDFIGRLADMAERCLDLEGLTRLNCNSAVSLPSTPLRERKNDGVKIAVARDAAFCFMYEDNLRLLREAGAELTFFSPICDTTLPPDISGIYLPGGYPELYAKQLESNSGMRAAIRAAVEANMPVYAECGGFVYLTDGLDESGQQDSADFAGVFPVRCRMLPRRKALGYRQAELMEDTAVGGKGAVVRGHEFHYSEIGAMPEEVKRCYQVSRQDVTLGMEGFRIRNCLASYIHLHFGSNTDIAKAFITQAKSSVRR
jgi:cobyrinic acid a,c-diamide synthase